VKCLQCKSDGFRFKRYDKNLEIWGCADCGNESPMLDCHCCERREVSQSGENEHGVHTWTCNYCGFAKLQCPNCHKGWLLPSEVDEEEGKVTGMICERCGA
jgi:hypothetical protein